MAAPTGPNGLPEKGPEQKMIDKRVKLLLLVGGILSTLSAILGLINDINLDLALLGTPIMMALFGLWWWKMRDPTFRVLNKYGYPYSRSTMRRHARNVLIISMSLMWVAVGIKAIFITNDSTNSSTPTPYTPRTHFTAADSSTFNVLITRFEDTRNTDSYTTCIGANLQGTLNTLNTQLGDSLALRLRVVYDDTLHPGNDADRAERLRQQHQADLILYGLAENLRDNCGGADVCFNFSLASTLLDSLPGLHTERERFGNQPQPLSMADLRLGKVNVSHYSLAPWLLGLTHAKAGQFDASLLALDKVLADTTRSEEERHQQYELLWRTYFELTYHRAALQIATAWVQDCPHRVEPFFYRALSNSVLKNSEAAIVDYDRALALESAFAGAYYNQGFLYANLIQYEKALADYDRALALDSAYTNAYINRGNVYVDLKQYEKALADFDRALALDPADPMAYHNRGVAYYHQQEYEKALADVNQALAMLPDASFIQELKSLILEAMGDQ